MISFDTILTPRLWGKSNTKWVGLIALGVSAACLLAVLAWVGLDLMEKHQQKKLHLAPQDIPSIAVSGPNYNMQSTVDANLFGDPNPPKVVKVVRKTSLDLTLQGILWASDNTSGRAIIQSGKKKTKLYSIGKKIEGSNVTLKEIRNNEVLLERGGVLESLAIVKVSSGGPVKALSSFENKVKSRKEHARKERARKAEWARKKRERKEERAPLKDALTLRRNDRLLAR